MRSTSSVKGLGYLRPEKLIASLEDSTGAKGQKEAGPTEAYNNVL